MKLLSLILSIYLLIFTNLTNAQQYLKSSSLLTCMEKSQFTASFFDVTFYPHNKTAVFDIDGLSTINAKIVAHIELIVYGLSVYTTDFKLCSINYATVCPLSSGHINIDSTYTIDSDQLDQVPGIAYTIPDLDAYVQVHVYDEDDTDKSEPLACVIAKLSNGKTVQTRYAGWPIAVVSGLGLIISGFVSILGHSATAAHIASNSSALFIYFQNLAIISMMGVSAVPPIAAAWAQNFQWTMGIINAKFMQDIFFWYVQSTGGTVTSIIANKSNLSISVQRVVKHVRTLMKRAISVSSSSGLLNALSDSSLYTTDERNVGSKTLILRGIQRVSYLAGIEISNFFLTGITFFLFIGFVLLILLGLFKSFCEICVRTGKLKEAKFTTFRHHWRSVTKGSLYRYFNICFPQITLLCIWEFSVHNSAGCVVLAVGCLLVTFVLLFFASFKLIVLGKLSSQKYKNPAYLLFSDEKILNRYGFLYVQYKADKYYWVLVNLVYLFIRALFIAVLQEQGKVCACLIFATEIIYCAVLIWKRPFMDKRTNIFNIFITVVNVINSIFFLFYSNVFGQPAVVSSVAGVVYFILNAVCALVLLIFTIVSCTLALIHKNPDTRYQPFKDDRVSFIPRQEGVEKSDTDFELKALGESAMRGHDRNSYYVEPTGVNPFDESSAGSSSAKSQQQQQQLQQQQQELTEQPQATKSRPLSQRLNPFSSRSQNNSENSTNSSSPFVKNNTNVAQANNNNNNITRLQSNNSSTSNPFSTYGNSNNNNNYSSSNNNSQNRFNNYNNRNNNYI
ncbi:hypothetical protein B5S28_g1738 [[Candida] boidinii]|nr:hypothetical protein B5S28_g1738 [[Candida] boidinii]OWB60780.1 hypothetical protein B5S29_g1661 [[Candida] boidinii]